MDFGYRKLYFNGQLNDAAAGQRKSVICPATGQQVAQIAWADADDATASLQAAAAGFEQWSKLSLQERTDWIGRLHDAVVAKFDLLRQCVMYETGKPWAETAEDCQTLVDALTYYPQQMLRTHGTCLVEPTGRFDHCLHHEPLGVVVASLAWNFPMLNLGFKLGPALAAGCSIILKPSAKAPLSAYLIGEICHEVGLPAGVVNVLCGSDDQVGTTLVGSRIPSLVTLIGSTRTARHLIEQSATSIKRMSMELGGNAPVLVFNDADLETAIQTVGALKFCNAGQICVTPNRVFVQQGVADAFIQGLCEHAAKVKLGFTPPPEVSPGNPPPEASDTLDSRVTMGPVIDRASRDRIAQLVDDAVADGAVKVYGDEVHCPPNGSYYPPTILTNVKPTMRIAREEIFGPVIAISQFDDETNILKTANDTDAGLTSYLFTQDLDRVRRLSHGLRFGEVMVNGAKYGIHLPHGGIKQSGMGHDGSHLALHDYLTIKRVSIRVGP